MEWYTWVVAGVLFVLWTWAAYAIGSDRGYMGALRFIDEQIHVHQAKAHMAPDKKCCGSQCTCKVEA